MISLHGPKRPRSQLATLSIVGTKSTQKAGWIHRVRRSLSPTSGSRSTKWRFAIGGPNSITVVTLFRGVVELMDMTPSATPTQPDLPAICRDVFTNPGYRRKADLSLRIFKGALVGVPPREGAEPRKFALAAICILRMGRSSMADNVDIFRTTQLDRICNAVI
jgi:hypothetical protein